ncbi:MAG: PQQ-binding-like beta-propeller repeat protein [Armatimonadota bacterium]|nr:PQQ-like beta-propeller repeat protein [Armatimonadota bacterium]MDW8026274.1 PQQ-binding-like beta-propeller repeat protein [Armatimonadota bacterium]
MPSKTGRGMEDWGRVRMPLYYRFLTCYELCQNECDGRARLLPSQLIMEAMAMKRLKRVTLILAAVTLCLIAVIGFVSVMYPWSRVSIFRLPLVGDTAWSVVPTSVKIFVVKRIFFKSAKLEGFQVRWVKVGEVVTFSDNNAICLLSVDKPVKGALWSRQYAQVEAFRMDDGSTLWTCTIPNPVWEKGESIVWELLTMGNEVWVIATSVGQINALDSQTGKLLWKYDFGFPIWRIEKGEQVVFVGHRSGILCFEPKDKRVLWEIHEEKAYIDSKVIDHLLQVFINPYEDRPAYTRWFSLKDGKPTERPPEVKRQKGEEIPNCVKQWLKRYKEASIVGQRNGLFLIGAENGTERLIAVDAKSGKAKWEVKTEISQAHCCGHNYQIAFAGKFVFYCVSSNHSFHPGEDSQLLAVNLETGSVTAKAEWIDPFRGQREEIRLLRVNNGQVIVASDFWVCKLDLTAK